MLPEIQVLFGDSYSPVPVDEFYFQVVPAGRRDPIPQRFLDQLLGSGITLAGDRFKPIALDEPAYRVLVTSLAERDLLDPSLESPDWIRAAHEWMAWDRVLSREAVVAWRELEAIRATQLKTKDITQLAQLNKEYSKSLARYLDLAARDKGELTK